MELDITRTARPCSKRSKRSISLFMLEIHHTPVEFSALGLFTINRATLTTVGVSLRFEIPNEFDVDYIKTSVGSNSHVHWSVRSEDPVRRDGQTI
ncbi:hypothetical protein J6590_074814 [Homalodisca vitripennis]|nr:hypothetical protein J6590_074814 [Homalodisca vitripennis]